MAEIKNWRNSERVWLKDIIPVDTPFTVNIEASSLCNARCVYCVRSTKRDISDDKNMPMELFEKVVRDMKGFPKKVKLIDMYNSGEPLCNPKLADMISTIKAADVTETIGFTTNALLFNKENIDRIIDSGIDVIRISLQGMTSETYKMICGVSMDFDKFIQTLRYLYKRKGECKIRMKIADIALKDEAERIKFEETFGEIADSIAIETIVPMYQDVDYDSVDNRISKRIARGRNGQIHEVQKVCYRPFIKIGVRANGKITASCCDFENDIIYGDAYRDNIVELWNSVKRKEFLKMQLKGERYKHPSCKNCMIPQDVTNEKDILDPYANEILKRL